MYSKEEITAELGAAHLCAEAGISNAIIRNQAACLSGWIGRLKGDSRLTLAAAGAAQKAADYILNRRPADESEAQAA